MNLLVDPDLEKMLAVLPPIDLSLEQLPVIRSLVCRTGAVSTPTVERTDHVIDEQHGVAVRVHRRHGHVGPAPCVLSMHAGGFVLGDRSLDDAKLHHWVSELGCVAVSVGYRLAPEAPFPGALDDCDAALQWIHDRAAVLGVDTERIGAAGLGAGGALAAALALRVRDRGEHQLAFQLLDAPMLDDRGTTGSSRRDGLTFWSRQSNQFAWRSYLGGMPRDEVPPHAAPARAVDLTELPPAFIGVGGHDGFLDEDVEYARRLNEAGVPAELHVYARAAHGFSALPGASAARAARDQLEWLARTTRAFD